MEIGVIITGHGRLASGILSGLSMVIGKTEKAVAIDFEPGDNFDDLDQKYLEAYENLSAADYVLVLADLQGGTPFTRAYLTLNVKGNVRFLSGVNFSMVYQALSHDADDIDQMIEKIIKKTQAQILEYR